MGAEGDNPAFPIDMQAAPAQPLKVERIGILKGHRRDRKTMGTDARKESIHIPVIIPVICACRLQADAV